MAEVSKTNPTVMTSTPPVARASASYDWSDRLSYCWYEAGFWLSFTGMTLAFSLRTQGYRNVPPAGPALLIANHQSFVDPWIVGLAVKRHLTYLARKTLFKNPLFAGLISAGPFPRTSPAPAGGSPAALPRRPARPPPSVA